MTFLRFLLITALLGAPAFADLQKHVSAFEAMLAKNSNGEKHTPNLIGLDEKANAYYRGVYAKMVEEVKADDSLSSVEKNYLQAMLSHEAAALYTRLDLQKENKGVFCQEFSPVHQQWKDFFSVWEKNEGNKKKMPNSETASDIFRLNGDMLVSYGPCVGSFAMIKLFTKALASFERALEINGNNAKAHFSMGTYRYYAPRIGGGSVAKAISRFELAIKNGNDSDRYVAHIFLAHAYMKNKNKKAALGELEKAKSIYSKGPYLGYAYSLISKGKYMQ